ncbi:DUF1176 domain-containing protein [Coralliovum pocilloporae]|uniref:DUF1176 domain-containing protein n=1 Tax=Coralliovum pocilloporae TaxID=3066369 RepID=UPI003307315A
MIRTGFRTLISALAFLGLAEAASAEGIKMNVQLFGTKDLEGFDGCRFALWQRGRNPEKNKYAYVFFMPFGGDGAPLPAWVKTSGKFYELERRAEDFEQVGNVARNSFYKDANGSTAAHVEVFEAEDTGRVTRITKADVTIYRSKKQPFRVNAEGIMGCPGSQDTGADAKSASGVSSTPAGYSVADAISLGAEQTFDDLRYIPRPVRQGVRNELYNLCDLDATPPFGSSYEISSALTLWQVPCFSGAYQGASVFAVVTNSNPKHFVFLPLQQPPALHGSDKYDAMLAQMDTKTGILTTTELSRGVGDCGVFARYQLVATEGEALEFRILEYREKLDCDGREEAPETWPLAWSAQ